jgi:hypothetical protein
LFWKHLDAITRAKCWRGLGADRTAIQGNTRGGAVPIFPEFSREHDDPEDIVEALLILSLRSELPAQVSDLAQVHELCIAITGDQWVAKCNLGTVVRREQSGGQRHRAVCNA